MEKVLFDSKFSSSAARSRTKPQSSASDSGSISNRWREVSERTPKEKVNEKSTPETSEGKDTKKKKIGKSKQPLSAYNNSIESLEDEVRSSPFDLIGQREEMSDASDKMISFISIEDSELEEGVASIFSTDQKKKIEVIDLHQNNGGKHDTSLISATMAEAAAIAGAQPTGDGSIGAMMSDSAVQQMEELMNKLASEISIAKAGGKTDTTIEIKSTPLFKGAKVTITEFDSAKNEFNIKFENLSTKAHEIVSMQANRESLKSALEQRGYNVHIITANTEIEGTEETFKGHQDRGGSDKHDEQQQREQQRDQNDR
ncbi:MAG: hypothetical protein VX777_02370 [Chlamydiota bacterium]|nr:hypothetical protein [Chlamydiota bacterium]